MPTVTIYFVYVFSLFLCVAHRCNSHFTGKKFCPFDGKVLVEPRPPPRSPSPPVREPSPPKETNKSPPRNSKFQSLAAAAVQKSPQTASSMMITTLSETNLPSKNIVLKAKTKIGLMSSVMTMQDKFQLKGIKATVVEMVNFEGGFKANMKLEMIPGFQATNGQQEEITSPAPLVSETPTVALLPCLLFLLDEYSMQSPAVPIAPSPAEVRVEIPDPPSSEMASVTSKAPVKKMMLKNADKNALLASIEGMKEKFSDKGIIVRVGNITQNAEGVFVARLQVYLFFALRKEIWRISFQKKGRLFKIMAL